MDTPPTHSVELPALPPIEVVLDQHGRIDEDVQCRACGYDLRGLTLDGRCPECAAAVGRSIHGDLLRFSDPGWVRALADGTWWMILAIFLGLGFGIGGGVIESLLGISAIGNLGGFIASVLSVIGYWKITMPDPGAASGPALNIRSATRILAVIGCGGSGFGFFLESGSGLKGGPMLWTVITFYIGFTLAGMIGGVLVFILMRRIALRIPNDSLATTTGVVMWGLLVGYGLLATLAVVALFTFLPQASGATVNPGPVFGLFAVVGGCTGGLALAIFGIWWVVLLFQYRKALFAATNAARRTWQHSPDVVADPP